MNNTLLRCKTDRHFQDISDAFGVTILFFNPCTLPSTGTQIKLYKIPSGLDMIGFNYHFHNGKHNIKSFLDASHLNHL